MADSDQRHILLALSNRRWWTPTPKALRCDKFGQTLRIARSSLRRIKVKYAQTQMDQLLKYKYKTEYRQFDSKCQTVAHRRFLGWINLSTVSPF